MPQDATTREVKTAIPLPLPAIAEFCRRWGVREFAVFGSILHPERFRPDSDVDVLVTLEKRRPRSLFDLTGMERDLESLFGRPVDVVEREAVEQSDNPYRRDPILQSAEVVHAR